jgi:hypothetical protein
MILPDSSTELLRTRPVQKSCLAKNSADLFRGYRKAFRNSRYLSAFPMPDLGDDDFGEFFTNLLKCLIADHSLGPAAERIVDT